MQTPQVPVSASSPHVVENSGTHPAQAANCNAVVAKRLRSELMQLMMNAPPGISAFPESDANMMKWVGTIVGPEGTYYEGFKFKVSLEFSQDYPFTAPHVQFVSPMYHPNVDMSGLICLDILRQRWSAVQNVQSVMLSLQSLLGEPNNSSPLNGEAARLWNNPEEYKKRLYTRCQAERM